MHGDGSLHDKGFLAFTGNGDCVNDDDEVAASNKRRYQFREVGVRDAHQIKCFDTALSREVWGTYEFVSTSSKKKIFVPNAT